MNIFSLWVLVSCKAGKCFWRFEGTCCF